MEKVKSRYLQFLVSIGFFLFGFSYSLLEFEEKTFEFLVDRIIVNQNELEFHLPGGLKFTEKI